MPYKDPEQHRQNSKERYARIKSDPEMLARYREMTNQWRNDNKEHLSAKRAEDKAKKRAYLYEMLGGQCVGCGTTENLQFDHIDRKDKKFTIGKKLNNSLEYLIPEAKKCQLLCKSCHQIKTTVQHDMKELADGYYVKSVENKGDDVIVTLGKLAQGS